MIEMKKAMKTLTITLVTLACLLAAGCAGSGEVEEEDEPWPEEEAAPKRPIVLARYQTWYQSPPLHRAYNQYWRAAGAAASSRKDGRVNISSKIYPLTGPYDSADTKVLEYQAALMTLAGIDGVIIEWHGIKGGPDYREAHNAAKAMISVIQKAHLKFAVCYQDDSLARLVSDGAITKVDTVNTAKAAFGWLSQNWFQDDYYLKVDGRPVVFCSGPQGALLGGGAWLPENKAAWEEVFAGLPARPFFIDRDNRTSWADSTYCWPPVDGGGGRLISPQRLESYLSRFYSRQEDAPFITATVFPAFDQFLAAGEKRRGRLDYDGGRVFRQTWEAAEALEPDIIQIASWNNYRDGTGIEPTVERVYRELEYVQDQRRRVDPYFLYTYQDLRIPMEFYKMLSVQGAEMEEFAGAAYTALFDGKVGRFHSAVRAAGISFEEEGMVFDSKGKPNLAFRKAVRASGEAFAGRAGSMAVDGDVRTYWEGAPGKWPSTIFVDLKRSADVSSVVLRLPLASGWEPRTQQITVRTSSGDGAWITAVPAANYLFDPRKNGNKVEISLSGKVRFVQLSIAANTGASAGQIAEFEVYETTREE